MRHITTEPIPILVWGELPDEGTMAQTRNLAGLPFAWHHVALMADAHVGFGMPIGGVMAADGQVIPHAVGLDIGCGVRAWRTNVPVADLLDARDLVLSDIDALGAPGVRLARAQPGGPHRSVRRRPRRAHAPVARSRSATRQIGTLGRRQSLLELQADPDGVVWAMVHSGSRNLGKQMAEHYDDDRPCREPPLRFARSARVGAGAPLRGRPARRRVPAGHGLVPALRPGESPAHGGRGPAGDSRGASRESSPTLGVDVHHNYAALEEHFGREVVVHRKGAVRAHGTVVVPGSMGTASYIGEGLASPDAFESCSHGAGRALGRRQAMRQLTANTSARARGTRRAAVQGAQEGRGRGGARGLQGHRGRDALAQADLVEPRVRLIPLGVVKG